MTFVWLLVPAAVAVVFARAAGRLADAAPQRSVWGLAVGSTVLAAAVAVTAAIAAWPLVARIPVVAAIGGWDAGVIATSVDVPLAVSCVAALGLVASLIRVARAFRRSARDWHTVLLAHRSLPVGPRIVTGPSLAGPAFAIPALPGRPGRIVLDDELVTALDSFERAAVLAHEDAHLRGGHAWAATIVALAAAANPILGPVVPIHALAVERAADEAAAGRTDRRTVARAVSKAALQATTSRPLVLGISPAVAATVSRVEALLVEPQPARARWAALLALPLLAILGPLVAGVHMEHVFELLMRAAGAR